VDGDVAAMESSEIIIRSKSYNTTTLDWARLEGQQTHCFQALCPICALRHLAFSAFRDCYCAQGLSAIDAPPP
jgi:hypothetical protein